MCVPAWFVTNIQGAIAGKLRTGPGSPERGSPWLWPSFGAFGVARPLTAPHLGVTQGEALVAASAEQLETQSPGFKPWSRLSPGKEPWGDHSCLPAGRSRVG